MVRPVMEILCLKWSDKYRQTKRQNNVTEFGYKKVGGVERKSNVVLSCQEHTDWLS